MKQYSKLITILRYLQETDKVSSYDEYLQKKAGIKQRQLLRELKAIEEKIDSVESFKIGKREYFKLVKPIDVLGKIFESEKSLSLLFHMAKEYMPDVFNEWNKLSKQKNKPFIFYNTPCEDIEKMEQNRNFTTIKRAIIEDNNIDFQISDGNKEREFINVAPIKLIFSEGNWYIAFVKDRNLILRRVNFITSTQIRDRDFEINIKEYERWLKNSYQNPFTLYGKEFKKGKFLVKGERAQYFKSNMKKFFKTQKVIREGSKEVIFSIDYTQENEVLPFIQRWMPDIEILEPVELRNSFRKRLEESLRAF